MANTTKPSKKYATISMDESDFFSLVDRATELGLRLSDYIYKMTMNGHEKDIDGSNELSHITYQANRIIREQENLDNLIQSLVIRLLNSNNNDDIIQIQLEKICNAIGRDTEEVIDDYVSRSISPQLLPNVKSGKEKEVYEWLIQQMKPDQYYSASDIEAKINDLGLSIYYLKKVKKDLNIESVKMSKGWFWVKRSSAENNEENDYD